MHFTFADETGTEIPVRSDPEFLQEVEVVERAGQVRKRRSNSCNNLEYCVGGIVGSTHTNL